jgi:bifunctional non-homologous end joining protein LigD
VEAIRPVPRPVAFDAAGWLFEPKYDGVRALLYVTGRDCCFRSPAGEVLELFQPLCWWVREELGAREAILDGEIVALDEHGRQDSRALRAGRGQPHFAAFDALWIDGRDLRRRPLRQRKRGLHRVIWATTAVVSQVFGVEERGRELFRAVERLDLEGLVAKRLDDPYAPGTVWYTVDNPAYTQLEGRRQLFERPR